MNIERYPIAYISHFDIDNLAFNSNIKFSDVITAIIEKLSERSSNILVDDNLQYYRDISIKYTVIIYYNFNVSRYLLSRYEPDDKTYIDNKLSCNTIYKFAEYLNNHINKLKNTKPIMRNDIIGYMDYLAIEKLAKNMCYSVSIESIKNITIDNLYHVINALIETLSTNCDLKSHISTDKKDVNKRFCKQDCAVLYYNNTNNTYNLGKWNKDTVIRSDDHNVDKHFCNTFIDINNKLINHRDNNPKFKIDETGLRKQDSIGRNETVKQGTAIEVQRVEPCIENGQSSYRGQACSG